MNAFARKKTSILSTLSTPDEIYTDASPKGSVDVGIRALVDQINAVPDIVTTSSCAGRIAIYLDGKGTAQESQDETTIVAGGKGGGRWLFVSHDPVHELVRADLTDSQLLATLNLNQQPAEAGPDLLAHFKFEPMILHMLCSSLSVARKVLNAALSAGFRESGISSINESGDMVMVAVRTNGLSLESIVGISGRSEVELLVSVTYIRMLLRLANDRFVANEQRKSRFADNLVRVMSEQATSDWEPADVRRARKRAEGLQRQQERRSRDDDPSSQDQNDLPLMLE